MASFAAMVNQVASTSSHTILDHISSGSCTLKVVAFPRNSDPYIPGIPAGDVMVRFASMSLFKHNQLFGLPKMGTRQWGIVLCA